MQRNVKNSNNEHLIQQILPLLDYQDLEKHTGLYPNIDPRALYSSFEDFEQILSRLAKGTRLVDLGCGDGRNVLYATLAHPEIHTTGVELSSSRIQKAQILFKDFDIDSDLIKQEDLKSYQPLGDVFYFYLPFETWTIDLINRIKGEIIICESHGDFIDKFERAFSYKYQLKRKIPLKNSRHRPFIYWYEPIESEKNIEQEWIERVLSQPELVIELGEWIVPADGFELDLMDEHFRDTYSDRSYKFSEITQLRAASSMEMKLIERLKRKEIRKILTNPLRVDLPGGRRVLASELR
jgi:SAM-dependent methyltransferase